MKRAAIVFTMLNLAAFSAVAVFRLCLKDQMLAFTHVIAIIVWIYSSLGVMVCVHLDSEERKFDGFAKTITAIMLMSVAIQTASWSA